MFGFKKKKLHLNPRYGKAETPSVHEFTLEKYYDLYSRSTEGAEKIHTLILGATPELRDIVLSYGHQLTVVDRNKEALEEKTRLMHYKNSPLEKVIIGDWLNIDFPANYFDVILGDGVLTALDKAEQQKLLKILKKILKPTGSLLLREEAKATEKINFDPSDIVSHYRSGHYNIFDLFFGLRLHNKNYKAVDPKTQRIRLQDFLNKLDEYNKNGIISQEELKQLKSVAEELEHTLLSKTEIEQALHNQFSPREITHDIGSGHLSPWYFFLHQPRD
ncbi:MAG: class I SAM-dependent methyltransferase [Patescibacteria group bacterium]|jgi:SAM-dependent methyltransferase